MKPGSARVLLTGASGGIGRAVAAALFDAGAAVMLTARNELKLGPYVASLKLQMGKGRVESHVADFDKTQQISELAAVANDWGCNTIVHSAGMASFGRLTNAGAAEAAQVLHTNLLAPILLTQAMLPNLLELPEARIICVGSVLGRLGLPGYSLYSASKFGLRGFAEALRRELTGTSVRVQYLGPRSTDTGFNSSEAVAYNKATGTQSDSPESVAKALVQMLEDGTAERFLGFPEKLAVRLNGLSPKLLDGAFAKHRASLT